MVKSRKSDSFGKRLSTRLHVTGTSIVLGVALVILQILQPQTAVFAAGQPIPVPTHQIGNGPISPPILTDKDITYNNEKQLLSNEYANVVQGKESSSLYEEHMTAFMQKHNLGNIPNLRNALATARLKKAALVASKFQNHSVVSSSYCPSIVSSDLVVPSLGCPSVAGAAQFPEFRSNYCGAAAVATILVEDSFVWANANKHGGDTIDYNPYVTSQPSSLGLPDEDMLAQSNYLNSPYPYGTDFSSVLKTLNLFVTGKGGQYATVYQGGSTTYTPVADNFRSNLVSDINTGWDLAGGLHLYDQPGVATLTGYTGQGEFYHWIPITFYTNSGDITYYADPIYAAPGYSTWAVPGPYTSTSTSNMITILSRMGYMW